MSTSVMKLVWELKSLRDELADSLAGCVKEIRSHRNYAGKVALEPTKETKLILRKARAAIAKANRSATERGAE